MILAKVIMYAQLLVVPAFMPACTKDSNTPQPATPVIPPVVITDTAFTDTVVYTYLALGDSYTIGQGVTEDARYPAQVVAMLQQNNIRVQTPEYIATSGWTTNNLLDGIVSRNPVGPYDIVTLLIGVNDQYQRRDTAGYAGAFTEALEKSIALAGGIKAHVFVLSIPDYSVTPFGGGSVATSLQIDQFNDINKAVTVAYGVAYINITDLTKAMGTDASLVADGLHPSGKEYMLWAQRLAAVMQAVYR